MALIICPECQQQISDQATVCPKCGFPLQMTLASELDTTSDEPTASITPNETASPVTAAPVKGKRVKPVIIGIIAVVCIALVAIVALFINKSAKERAAIAARSEYIENLQAFASMALSGGAKAETVCNLTKSVWYDTIYEEYDVETAPYTRTNGKFNEDFNTSLSALYSSSEMISSISEIEDNQAVVEELYKKLADPEPEFEKCFEVVEDLYSVYYKFTKLAISPSGSLKSYSEDFSEYDSDFMEHYNKLLLLIPES